MHTLRGGLVVQTVALSKSNESEGRKTRIRRSKEERKTMVETFIKKYQSSNSGNFPSLNLTHKEVGGSFYTVREIVREIIQENRVLGPAKFSSEELAYQQNQHDPLNLTSIDPSNPLFMALTSNGSHVIGSENQKSGNDHFVNGHQVDVTTGESAEQTSEEIGTGEVLETGKNLEAIAVVIEESGEQTSEGLQISEKLVIEEKSDVSTNKVTSTTEGIVIETFPLRPVSNTVDVFDTSRTENLTETSEECKTEKINVQHGNGSALSSQINPSPNSDWQDGEKPGSHASAVSDRKSVLVDSKEVENIVDSPLKSLNVHSDVDIEVSDNGVLASKINEHSQTEKLNENKVVNASNGHISNGTYASSNSRVQVRTPVIIVTENEANVQGEVKSHEGGNPRESWQRASRKSAGTESNPILAILKSFVTAFIKFWSE